MSYDDEPRRRRPLTPLESELRASEPTTEPWAPGRRSAWRRLRDRRRARRPPQTLAGAIVRGLVGLAIAVGVCVLAALAFSDFADRTFAVGLYVLGAVCTFSGIVAAGKDREYSASTGEPRLTAGAVMVVAGLLTIALGVLAEVAG